MNAINQIKEKKSSQLELNSFIGQKKQPPKKFKFPLEISREFDIAVLVILEKYTHENH